MQALIYNKKILIMTFKALNLTEIADFLKEEINEFMKQVWLLGWDHSKSRILIFIYVGN